MVVTPSLIRLATGRSRSFFQDDLDERRGLLSAALGGARVLVIGGAGSIGSATVRLLAEYAPEALHVVDISENGLVELVRDLRGSPTDLAVRDFRALPLDFGSEVFHRHLNSEPGYDFVLNFAALKHVRSEKEVCSVLQMIDTNVVKQAGLVRWLAESGRASRYFSVSTDKAANPVNLMGATKRLMEHVAFGLDGKDGFKATSARFANVAYSDGSLLQGWFLRLEKRQPLAVPRAARRYFISLEEAGQICLLAAVAVEPGLIVVPKLNPREHLRELEKVASDFLAAQGYEAHPCGDEGSAKRIVEVDIADGRYPMLVTPLDTTGEKPYEEFVGNGERVHEVGMRALSAVIHNPPPRGSVERFLTLARSLIADPTIEVTKFEVVAMLKDVVPEFAHRETGKLLDERL